MQLFLYIPRPMLHAARPRRILYIHGDDQRDAEIMHISAPPMIKAERDEHLGVDKPRP